MEVKYAVSTLQAQKPFSALKNLLKDKCSLDAYKAIADRYVAQNNLIAARDVYQAYVEQCAEDSEGYRELGVIQEKLEDFDGQARSYRSAIALNEDQPYWLFVTLARRLADKGKTTEAIYLYQKAFQRHESEADGLCYAELARLWSKKGDISAALANYSRARELAPDLEWVKFCIETLYYNQGVDKLLAGDIDKASQHFAYVDQAKQSWEIPDWFKKEDVPWPHYKFDNVEQFEALKPAGVEWPKISIITPSLNQGNFIEETILSVLNQAYENVEYIVVDGKSIDTTVSVLAQYQEKISITLVEEDIGQSDAINKGFRSATGEILGWLNSDDMLAPGALYKVALSYLEKPCDIVAGICLAHRDKTIEMVRKPRVRQEDFTVDGLSDLQRWEAGEFFFQPEALFTRELWERCGSSLNKDLNYAMDHELWIRFAEVGAEIQVVDWPVGLFRKHDGQKTAREQDSISELIKVSQRYQDSKTEKIEERVVQEVGSEKMASSVMAVESYRSINDLFEAERWQEMLEVCRRFVELNPTDPEGHRWLGVAQEKVNDAEGQLESFQSAIELDPLQPDWVYLVAAQLMIRKQRWDDAIALLKQTLDVYPSSAEAYRWIGFCQEHIGDLSGEIASYSKAIELDPNQPDWVHDTLRSLVRAKTKFEKATANYAITIARREESVAESTSDSTKVLSPSEQISRTAHQHSVPIASAGIIVFMPYYKSKSPERQEEFIYCLKKNIACESIEKLYLLIDDGHVPEISSHKIEIISFKERPTYKRWIELTEEICLGKISVLANTDIHFDKSVLLLRELFKADLHAFVALSRYEKEGDSQTLHKNPHWSQDVWAVHGDYAFSERLKTSLDIPLGIPRCDNKIAYLFAIHGSKIYNPCNQVKTVHAHETQLRSYSKKGDASILGGTAWVYPCESIDRPSELRIDVWTLNASEIIGVQTNDSLVRWRKQEERPKKLIAHDADWQFPAITEQHAYRRMKEELTGEVTQRNVAYFGFPWATLIDELMHGQADDDKADVLLRKLLQQKEELSSYKRVVTVCQHIHMLKFDYLFSEVGITDIFWSHTTKDQSNLPSYPDILLHPFPLYPVQAVNFDRSLEVQKKHLYSFVGTRSTDIYLTNSRNDIIDYLSEDQRGLIIARDKWHYDKVVYDHQILKQEGDAKKLIDQSASEEFRRVMQESIFSLCPSGSGPNSIRLWEAIGFNSIPVVLADTYQPPGDLKLWKQAVIECSESLDAIKTLPSKLSETAQNKTLIDKKKFALNQLWALYGPSNFVCDVVELINRYESGDIPSCRTQVSSKTALRIDASAIRNKKKKEVTKEKFKPSYVWPSPEFPFRLYYNGPECRIFIIENIQHNWDWMSACHSKFRETDFFFVMSGWYQSPGFADEADTIFSVLKLNKENFFFLFNSPSEIANFARKGFKGDVINQGAWLDESLMPKPLDEEKIYDAIYMDFHKKNRRCSLASKVPSLALAARWGSAPAPPDAINYSYINKEQLSLLELSKKLSQSYCGLILSEEEGASETSCTYLFCGLPVVSTLSKGGRDVWYTEQNSIICNPDNSDVHTSVKEFATRGVNPHEIRDAYIEQAKNYRSQFIEHLGRVFARFGSNINPDAYFKESFFHKMRKTSHIETVIGMFN